MAHLTVLDGRLGGGERDAQSIFEYGVPAGIFPVDAHYVALGHLHRRQTVPASARCTTAARRWPSTSASRTTRRRLPGRGRPGTPARVTDVPITVGPPAAHRARAPLNVELLADPDASSRFWCASRPGPGTGEVRELLPER